MLLIVLSLLAFPLGYYLLTELKGYLKILRYRKQGIKIAKYSTVPQLLSRMGKFVGSNDPFSEKRKMMAEQDPSQPFMVSNFGSKCSVNLISEKAIKDFYAKEIEVSIKDNPMEKLNLFSFIMENGEKIHEKRAVFSKIFHYSNILNLMPGIRNVIRNHVRKLKQRAEADGGQVKIDFKKEFSKAVFDDLTATILLGGAENKLLDTFEGMTVTELVQKQVIVFNKSANNPLRLIPYASELGLIKEEKELVRIQNVLINILEREYKKRYNKKNLDDTSVLGISINLNKESEKETGKPKLEMWDIASNFALFHFAASDTSFHLSCSTLTSLSLPENHKHQKRIQAEVDSELDAWDSYSNDKLNSLKELSNVFRETFRILNPTPGVTRTATKDFKVDGYTIYKGDLASNSLINFEPESYKNPLKYNPDRFNKDSPDFKRAPKLKEIPFSHGQRSCIGRYLGEMMVKLIVVEVLKEFEVSVEPGYVMKLGFDPLYTVKNPELVMKVRRSE